MSNISDPVRIPVQRIRETLIERRKCYFTPGAAREFVNLVLLSCDKIDENCKQCKECKER